MADRPRVVALITAFNEVDIIRQTVGDLVEQGIGAYVIDDGSTDGTGDALEPLLSTGLVRLERWAARESDDAAHTFRWTQLLARKEQLAGELEADWFIHHDADEFRESPWAHLDLGQAIGLVDRLGYNAIDFAVFNFQPTDDSFDGRADVRQHFRYYEPPEAFDRLQVKCWRKTTPVDLTSSGGHEARFTGRRVFPVRFILRHYPVRGQAHGVRKVFTERKPRFAVAERTAGWHVQYDALRDDHRFIKDPATLTLFDADLARVHLQMEHRDVEAAHQALASLETALRDERETLQSDLRMLERRHLETTAELQRQNREAAARADALQGEVAGLSMRLADITQSWSWALTRPLRIAGGVVLSLFRRRD